MGLGQHGQVRALHRRPQEGVGAAPAPAVLLRRLHAADAIRLAVVVVGVEREVAGPRGVDDQVGELAGVGRVGDVEGAADAVVVLLAGAALAALGALEVGQDLVPAPAGAAVGRPAVVVDRAAAHVEHRVHRARAAERLAARDVEAAVVAARLGLGLVVPVELRLELLGEGGGDRDLRRAAAAAGLDQQHLDAAVLAQPRRQQAAGGPGADDHVVVVVHLSLRLSTRPRHGVS